MSSLILQGHPPVEVVVKRSARARRITLRVSRLDGRVTMTLPIGVPEAEGASFAQSRRDWILRNLDQTGAAETVGIGTEIPVLGDMRRIVPGSGRRVVLTDAEIAVPGTADTAPRRLESFLKQLARSELAYASDRYAERLGRAYNRISIRDTRSRWGSCSSAGALMYSWRLILAPAEVLAYVAAHEVAHLEEMNHSPAFWARVEDIHGPYKAQRSWLRRNGHHLHRYRFGS